MVKFKMILAALLVIAAGQAWSEIKAETLFWADYSHSWIQTNYSATNVVVENGGQFYIGRAYITLQGDIGKDPFGGSLKGRVTLDMVQSTPGYLKYAYLDYKLFGWDPLVITAGLLKTQFGNLGFWEYPLPVKDATETYSAVTPTASADFGVAISGSALPIEGLTKNLVSYYLQFVNGAGYKTAYSSSSTTDLSQFAVLASIYLSPINGTKIGFSYRTEPTVGSSAASILTNSVKNSWAVMASASELKIGDLELPVDFVFQYIYNENVINTNVYGGSTTLAANVNGNVLSVSLGFGLFDRLIFPYARFDMVNENTAQTNTATKAYNYNILMFGLDYKPTKNMTLKPFYSQNLTTGSIQLMLECEAKLNFAIWQ